MKGYLEAHSSASMADQACCNHGKVTCARSNIQKGLSFLGTKRLQ